MGLTVEMPCRLSAPTRPGFLDMRWEAIGQTLSPRLSMGANHSPVGSGTSPSRMEDQYCSHCARISVSAAPES